MYQRRYSAYLVSESAYSQPARHGADLIYRIQFGKNQQDDGSFGLCQQAQYPVTCNEAIRTDHVKSSMKLCTTWPLTADLASVCLPSKLLFVCRGRPRGAINWDGTGRCVCKAFGELSPVLCFLHGISNPLVPKLACGRADWSSCTDSSDSPLRHLLSPSYIGLSSALPWLASVSSLLKQGWRRDCRYVLH